MKKFKTNNESAVHLGSLGVMVYFKPFGQDAIFRTITYAPMNTCAIYGTRWCLNMKTLKAESMFCSKKVIPISEHSEINENK